MNKSGLEQSFEIWLGQNDDIPRASREYRFHPERKWRFDFAWPDRRFAVELEGLLYGGGRHQRIAGYIGDCEKYEAAMLLGWTVYRVPGQWVQQGDRAIWRQGVMDAIREMLRCANAENATSARSELTMTSKCPHKNIVVKGDLARCLDCGKIKYGW